VLYKGTNGTVAHECIVDPRSLKSSAGVEVEDIAKRLMDFGFHAPTVVVPGRGHLDDRADGRARSKAELDRFCDALIAIREEIREIELGIADRDDNPLKHAAAPARARAQRFMGARVLVASARRSPRHGRACTSSGPPWGRVEERVRLIATSCVPVRRLTRMREVTVG